MMDMVRGGDLFDDIMVKSPVPRLQAMATAVVHSNTAVEQVSSSSSSSSSSRVRASSLQPCARLWLLLSAVPARR
jgi:hypothetical protein